MLFARFLKLVRSKASKDSFWVLIGNLLTRVLGLLSFIIITRVLGPQEYGLFSVSLGVLTMVSDLSDLGINASAIRYGAQYAANQDITKLKGLYSIVMRTRLILGVIVFSVGMLFARPLAVGYFQKPELTVYLMLTFGGVFGLLLYSALVSLLQANQQFSHATMASVIYSLSNLVVISVLWVVGKLSSITSLGVYIFSPVLAAIVAYRVLQHRNFDLHSWDAEVAKKLFNFSKWMSVWAVAYLIQSRLDIFMLTRMTNVEVVGYYNAATRIAALAIIIPVVYGTVITPKLASMAGTKRLIVVFKQTLFISGLLAIGMFVVSLLSPWIIRWMIGEQYEKSSTILQIHFIAWGFSTLSLSFSSILNAWEKPWVFAVGMWGSLILMYVLNIWNIPIWGGVGAAISFACSQIFILLVYSGSTLLISRKMLLQAKQNSF
jgi:O-antigen/teichoic acid export membrane protein